MQITLSPDAQAIIDRKLASGDYDSADAVINEALLHLPDDGAPPVPEEWLAEARAQAERGDTTPWTEDYLERSSHRAREKARRGHKVRDEARY